MGLASYNGLNYCDKLKLVECGPEEWVNEMEEF